MQMSRHERANESNSASRTAPRTTTGPAGMALPDAARRWPIAAAHV
eukprot:COSAG02_NODE_41092_length_398_cov_0.856187_2_plen_45_part_01